MSVDVRQRIAIPVLKHLSSPIIEILKSRTKIDQRRSTDLDVHRLYRDYIRALHMITRWSQIRSFFGG